MFAVFHSVRKLWTRARAPFVSGALLLALAACEPIDFGGFGSQLLPGRPVQVALLVPSGSGNSSDELLAQSLENAARLAAGELEGVTVDLRVYSTAANAQVAATQAQQAVDDGAKIIIGPVYAEAANAAGVAVAGSGVNLLAFSNNTAIAGGNVFVLGPTFDNTARRLMSYATSQGRSKVVVVHGDDVAGQTGRNAIQSAASGAGAQVVGTVQYELSQQGVSQSVPEISTAVGNTGADTLFLTSTSSGALPLYSSFLPGAGVRADTIQFIGLTRWDIPVQTLALPGLQGGWFALPDPTRTAAFRSRYEAAYGGAPHPIGGLGFDAVAAIGALAASGDSDALTKAMLTQPQGFQGVSGAFRLRADGTNERALAVAKVEGGQPVIIDPAPVGFAGL